ncbi:MAG: HAD-IC family P-type ATPase, partial [Candidatus Gastranaerophilales bacterium]|nr:HAD-IC family P-type ATPase [Candidatus Gastranaerophilales bacterium]
MYYKKTVKEVFNELDTNERGLSGEEAKKRLKDFGFNSIKPEKAKPLWRLIINQFTDPLIYILLIAAFFTIFIRHHIDTIAILSVVVINAIIGFFQEYKAEKAMQALKKLTTLKAIVVRNCMEERIDSTEIVPGDIIVLTAGNKVPADLRLFEENELEIDESAFTGESIPARKQVNTIKNDNTPIMNQTNMTFMGTIIVNGKGKGVVVKTGERTELGKISLDVKTTEREITPLQKKLKEFSIKIGSISLGLSLTVFFIGILKGLTVSEMILFSISMAVSIIPEGLPIVVTIAMAIGLKKMANKNAIIRRLIAVETLGSCNYICTDKTGTITENQMTVTKAYANGKIYDFTGIGYKPEGNVFLNNSKVKKDDDLNLLLLTGLLCNSAVLYEDNGEWKIDGDPTEGALIVAADKFGINIEKKEFQYKLVDEIPFSSKRQYMATLYKTKDENMLFVKGAPEKILSFSNNIHNFELSKHYLKMAESGLRVLGFGIKKLNIQNKQEVDIESEATHNLEFVGFQGIIDPPRENVIEAIKNTHNAGINVVMLTGDHKITAAAIAKQVGILKDNKLVITGQELDSNNNDFLVRNIENIAVYARVSPEHKFQIIEMLQQKGNIVAVTGDGINDAPALKKANIGVAMGKSGTDVAKEAADMVLKDDNYASIFEAVKVGRI